MSASTKDEKKKEADLGGQRVKEGKGVTTGIDKGSVQRGFEQICQRVKQAQIQIAYNYYLTDTGIDKQSFPP